MDRDALAAELRRDEGVRLKVYNDSKGIPSIGVGRNLRDRGITQAECDMMLQTDIAEHCALLDKYTPWWRQMDEIRQRVLANMGFNMGVGPSAEQPDGKLLTFHNTLKAMQDGNYEAAAGGMASSAWAKQVGKRADRLVAMMRTGAVA